DEIRSRKVCSEAVQPDQTRHPSWRCLHVKTCSPEIAGWMLVDHQYAASVRESWDHAGIVELIFTCSFRAPSTVIELAVASIQFAASPCLNACDIGIDPPE